MFPIVAFKTLTFHKVV